MNLKLHRKPGSNNQVNLQYRVIYHDKSNNTVIRADNNHPYPHLDLELPNRKQEKRVFDTPPSDYEASINSVLRYAEYYNSSMIGVDYWLFNMMGAKKELRKFIHSSFKNAKMFLNPQTSFTDIARLISVDVYRANKTYYSVDDLSSLIVRKLNYCKQYEQQNRRPIKISKNLIQDGIDDNLFPFPLIADSTTPVTRKVIDKNGKELSDTCVKLIGKTSFATL